MWPLFTLRCSTSMPQSRQLMRPRLWTRPANTRTATTRLSAASRSILWSRRTCSQNNCNLVCRFSFFYLLPGLVVQHMYSWNLIPVKLLCIWILCVWLWDWLASVLGKPTSCFLVVGAFHSQDQSGGHQQPSQQGPGFGRQAQSFYNSRGMSRGGPRNARGMINGYRGSSNGFRGEFTINHKLINYGQLSPFQTFFQLWLQLNQFDRIVY